MEAQTTLPKLIPFTCPICAAATSVALVPLARSGQTACTSCGRVLSAGDVSRAMHSPRVRPRGAAGHHITGARLGGTRPR